MHRGPRHARGPRVLLRGRRGGAGLVHRVEHGVVPALDGRHPVGVLVVELRARPRQQPLVGRAEGAVGGAREDG